MTYATHPNPPADWPHSVPVLEAENICKGILQGPNGTHCLLGWEREVWRTAFTPKLSDFMGMGVIWFNDTKPPAVVAGKWNEWIAHLGYVIEGSKP